MSSFTMQTEAFLVAFVFGLACFFVGAIAPKNALLQNYPKSLQYTIIGYCAFLLLYRLPYRHDVEELFIDVIFVTLIIIGFLKLVLCCRPKSAEFLCLKPTNNGDEKGWQWLVSILVPFLPLVTILVFPSLSRDALFFFNHGPDNDGNLMSSSYLLADFSRRDLVALYETATGHDNWWNLKEDKYLALPDFRDPTAIEFFLRSHRWGHASLTALLSRVADQQVWVSFFALLTFSAFLVSRIFFAEAKRLGLSFWAALSLATALGFSQTYILMIYEGINVQLIATPIFLFLLFRTDWLLGQGTLINQLLMAFFISSLLGTYGEGVQILGVFWIVLLLTHLTTEYHLARSVEATLVTKLFFLGIFVFLIDPIAVIDFIKWSYGRYEFGFAGGALFKDWLITPVLSSIPYLHLTGSKDPGIVLFFSGSFFLRLLEAFAFAVFGYFLFRYCRNRGIVMIAISLTLVIFSLPDHAYAIWKVATALQPLFVIVVASVLWSRLKVSQFAVWMRLYLTINILGFSLLLANYFDYAQPANAGQMPFVINQPIHQNYVFVTPSQSRIYLQIGYVRPLTWANGGYRGPNWEPNFNYLTSNELRLVAYFDCDAEGLQRCERIKRFSSELVERTFTEIDIELSEIIDSNGIVDRQKLNRAVEEIFGVKPLGNFNPRDPAFKH